MVMSFYYWLLSIFRLRKLGWHKMTREEAKELINILQGWIEYKQIQVKNNSGSWENATDLVHLGYMQYRIKPSDSPLINQSIPLTGIFTMDFKKNEDELQKNEQYRPFNNGVEFSPCREKWIKSKDFPLLMKIIGYNDVGIFIGDTDVFYNILFSRWIFEDGTPCGVKI
jgi:hypothetical protein